MIEVSVIIPVYNAEKYIEKAVGSALQFDIVKELILIEDGSKDESNKVCNKIQKSDVRIHIHRHPKNRNLGAGASRNLGIQKSTCEYIAFLDADDYYLPNRFDAEIKYTKEGIVFNGVFGALGFHYYDQKLKKKLQKTLSTSELTTVNSTSNFDQVFEGLLGINKKWKGYFHINTLTIKKESLNDLTYYFNPNLRLHQDTEFILRYSYYNNLKPGFIDEPIGMRGVHESNRITSKDVGIESRFKLWESLLQWSKINDVSLEAKNKIHAEFKYYDFFSKNSKVNTIKLLNFICSDKVLFFNDKYLRMGADIIHKSPKVLKLLILLKEIYVNTFMKNREKKYSIYIN